VASRLAAGEAPAPAACPAAGVFRGKSAVVTQACRQEANGNPGMASVVPYVPTAGSPSRGGSNLQCCPSTQAECPRVAMASHSNGGSVAGEGHGRNREN